MTLLIQLIDWLYSLYFCWKVFPFSIAIHTPINISHNVKIGKINRGAIELSGAIYHNKIFIGHQGYSAIAEQNGLTNIEPGGKIIFEGTARFAQGIRIWVDCNATLIVGDNFYCNKNCLVRAFDDIIIGKNVLLGWDIELNTTDGHNIIVDDQYRKNHGKIVVGDHVWIASHVTVSKGSFLSADSVVAQHSLVSLKFEESNVLLGGIPAKKLKSQVRWEE